MRLQVLGIISIVAVLIGLLIIAWSPVALVVHELGHAVTGRLVGFRVLRIVLGSGAPLLQRRWKGVDIVVGRRPSMGRVVAVRDDEAGWRWRFAAMCAGGPLANALVVVATGAAIANLHNLLIAGLGYTLAVANAVMLVNLLRFDFVHKDDGRPGPSDGRQIYQMLTREDSFIREKWLKALEHETATHLQAGRVEEARACAARLLLRAPESLLANLVQGHAAIVTRRWDQALACYRRARAVFPRLAGRLSPDIEGPALNGLAWAALRLEHPSRETPLAATPSALVREAREAAETAVRLLPDNAGVLDTCAEAWLRTGRVDEGVALLERAWGGLLARRGSDTPVERGEQASVARALAFGTAIQGYPGRAVRWRALAEALEAGGTLREALGEDGVAQAGDEVWATRAFAVGDVLGSLPEHALVTTPSRWTIQVSATEHLPIEGPFAYLEHACQPNTRVDVAARTVVARRPIAPGERLTFFYPSTEWAIAERFACRCGQPGCLGSMGGARDLPAGEVLARDPAPHIVAALAVAAGPDGVG